MTDEMKEAARRGRRATNSKGQSFPFLQYNGELADSLKLRTGVSARFQILKALVSDLGISKLAFLSEDENLCYRCKQEHFL